MRAALIGAFRAGSREWHEARHAGLGGSEIAAVVGLSPWESAWHLWQVKAGNLEPSNSDSVRLRIGTRLEDAVVSEGEHRGHFMRRTGMWQHKERPWQLAEPDRLLTKTARGRRPVGVYEAKTVDPSVAWEWGPDGGGADDIPPHYRAQVAWYLSCLDLPYGILGALIGFGDYREYRIERSMEDEEWLLGKADAFIDSLEKGVSPDIDGSDVTYRAVRAMHPEISLRDQEVPTELAMAYVDAQEAAHVATTAARRQKSRLLDAMGDARTAVTPDGDRVAQRRPGRGGSVSLYQLLKFRAKN